VNRSVPTLLGIVIILLVVVLVVLIYNYRLTQQLGSGATVVGTVGGKALTGVEPPTEEIGAGEVLGRREAEVEAQPSPTQRPGTRSFEVSQEAEAKRAAREAGTGRAGSPAEGTEPTRSP
jgi:hypothetical protein